MPQSPAERAAAQAACHRAAQAADRRRELANMLRISASTCSYASTQLANGIGPAEAREVALFTAGELVVMAEALRKLTRPTLAERKALARELTGLGWPARRVADRLGVHERTVWRYLGHP